LHRPTPAYVAASVHACLAETDHALRPADDGHTAHHEQQRLPPLTKPHLTLRDKHLFQAIVENQPELADDFFFPKEPFIPLKDVADPARYFDQLMATYHRDIASLHAKRKDWSGAAFVSFDLGTTPGWVAPGKEYNKIG